MKSINEKFLDDEMERLIIAKDKYRKEIKKDKLNWHDFILAKCLDDKSKQKSESIFGDFNLEEETKLI